MSRLNIFPKLQSLVLLAGVIASTACAEQVEPLAGLAASDAGLRAQSGSNCTNSRHNCPTNSPIVGHRGVHEIQLDGEANPQGLYLHRFHNDGIAYRLDVLGTRIVARSLKSGKIALQHKDLEGSVIELRSTDPLLAGLHYDLTIQFVNEHGAAYQNDTTGDVETYQLRYTNPFPTNGDYDLCRHPNADIHDIVADPNVYEVVLFAGDRYDASALEVINHAADNDHWLNIGCMGGLLSKMLLHRYSPAGFTPAFQPDHAARQTLLNVFSANYCGDGTPYTLHGEPILVATREQGIAALGKYGSIEAIWGPEGALCLNTPRLADTAAPWGGPALLDELKLACGKTLGSCRDLIHEWQENNDDPSSGLMVSANPAQFIALDLPITIATP